MDAKNIGIRYAKDGDIETYDTRTGKTIGHITTMGNYCVPPKERSEQKRRIAELARKRRKELNH